MENQRRGRAKQCHFYTISSLRTYQLEEGANLTKKERSFEKVFEWIGGTKNLKYICKLVVIWVNGKWRLLEYYKRSLDESRALHLKT